MPFLQDGGGGGGRRGIADVPNRLFIKGVGLSPLFLHACVHACVSAVFFFCVCVCVGG